MRSAKHQTGTLHALIPAMETRIIKNRLNIGKSYRVQLGAWTYLNRLHDGSPSRTFIVAYEQDAATRDEARTIAATIEPKRLR